LISTNQYDYGRFYRTINGASDSQKWVTQFGVPSDPSLSCIYGEKLPGTVIPDDAIDAIDDKGSSRHHNNHGYMAFSASYTADASRATNRSNEVFINLADNKDKLDHLNFPVVGRVTSGYHTVVQKLYAGYGEMSDTCDLHDFLPCNGPTSSQVYSNALGDFPRLDTIYNTKITYESWPLHAPNTFFLSLFITLIIILVAIAAPISLKLTPKCYRCIQTKFQGGNRGRYTLSFDADDERGEEDMNDNYNNGTNGNNGYNGNNDRDDHIEMEVLDTGGMT
jgi:hypothetical protein